MKVHDNNRIEKEVRWTSPYWFAAGCSDLEINLIWPNNVLKTNRNRNAWEGSVLGQEPNLVFSLRLVSISLISGSFNFFFPQLHLLPICRPKQLKKQRQEQQRQHQRHKWLVEWRKIIVCPPQLLCLLWKHNRGPNKQRQRPRQAECLRRPLIQVISRPWLDKGCCKMLIRTLLNVQIWDVLVTADVVVA